MKMVSHSYVECEAKNEGDEEPIKAWKSHNGECHLIHQNVDIIASRLGVSFYTMSKGYEEFSQLRAHCGKCRKSHKKTNPSIHPKAVPSCVAFAPVQAMVSNFPSAFKKLV